MNGGSLMQYLKPELKESILNAAIEEFYTKGYEKASMKQIANKTGISVGNVYRYYANKEAVFHGVVVPVYEQIIQMIEQDHREEGKHDALDLSTLIEVLGTMLASILVDHRKPLIILLDKSQGTSFEHAKTQIFNSLTAHVKEHFLEKEI